MRRVWPYRFALPFAAMVLFGLIDVARTAWIEPGKEAVAHADRDGARHDGNEATPGATPARHDIGTLEVRSHAPAPAVPRAEPRPYPTFVGPRPVSAPRVVQRNGLRGAIEKALATKSLRGAKVSVLVRSLATGEDLFSRYSREPRKVASNAKIVTTASALVHLGPEFEFVTRVHATGPIVDGVLQGDLVVIGDGDPDPVTRPEPDRLLHQLIAVVRNAGVNEVSGRLWVDDRIFDQRFIAEGWNPSQLGKHYCSPVSGFTIHENSLRVDVTPSTPSALAEVRVYPRVPCLRPQIQLKTGTSKSANLIDVPAPVTPGNAKVRGSTPAGSRPVPIYVPWVDAAPTSARVLFEALTTDGQVDIHGGYALLQQSLPTDQVELIGSVQRSLVDVLERMNKDSANGVAEHVYKRAGAAMSNGVGGGSFPTGRAAALDAMTRLGVDLEGARSVDGSGLSRGNYFTVRQLVGLLSAMYSRPSYRQALVATFPRMGVEGTLRKRLRSDAYRERVIAKSGYITRASALSGFAQTDSGEVLAFSILLNDFSVGNHSMKQVQEEIVKALVDLAPVENGS